MDIFGLIYVSFIGIATFAVVLVFMYIYIYPDSSILFCMVVYYLLCYVVSLYDRLSFAMS